MGKKHDYHFSLRRLSKAHEQEHGGLIYRESTKERKHEKQIIFRAFPVSCFGGWLLKY
jgi:hypothetical protein